MPHLLGKPWEKNKKTRNPGQCTKQIPALGDDPVHLFAVVLAIAVQANEHRGASVLVISGSPYGVSYPPDHMREISVVLQVFTRIFLILDFDHDPPLAVVMDNWLFYGWLLLFSAADLLECMDAFSLLVYPAVLRPARRRCSIITHSATPESASLEELYHTLRLDKSHGGYEELEASLEKGGIRNFDLLLTICRDYFASDQITAVSCMLQQDFGLSALQAHIARTLLWIRYRQENEMESSHSLGVSEHAPPTTNGIADPSTPASPATKTRDSKVGISNPTPSTLGHSGSSVAAEELQIGNKGSSEFRRNSTEAESRPARLLYKDVSLSRKKEGRSQSKSGSYGVDTLPEPLESQLQQYHDEFMTRPNPYHPSSTPLRPPTAQTYLKHARLFLGWYVAQNPDCSDLREVIPDTDASSVNGLLSFVRFLREERSIASSYEANVWRGLTKLLQFRFSMLVEQTLDDTAALPPALRQVRKWHRQAMQASQRAPRRSREDKKWLSWPQYLGVVEECRKHVQDLLAGDENDTTTKTMTPAHERKVAVAMQKYLVLAIFATLPDRQRTIRELQLGESLIQDASGTWCIQHSADAYKTGKTYGERPLFPLTSLTPDLNLFIDNWREKLSPSTDFLFVQSRTGNPLTRDSVYQIVGRTCYQYTGQKTNPHLLRDMIVTHVRENPQTSEQELEALALLMGHSLAVQRSSYDRRTLSQKVAPAMSLLEKVNQQQRQ